MHCNSGIEFELIQLKDHPEMYMEIALTILWGTTVKSCVVSKITHVNTEDGDNGVVETITFSREIGERTIRQFFRVKDIVSIACQID